MLAHDYAQALAAVLKEGKDVTAAFSSLDAVLQKRGHEKLKSRILRELPRTLLSDEDGRGVIVVADEEDLKTLKQEIEEAGRLIQMPAHADTKVDASLIGGFLLKTKHARFDRSYKQALISLYRSVITK